AYSFMRLPRTGRPRAGEEPVGQRRVNLQWKLLGNAGLLIALMTAIAIMGISSLSNVNRIARDSFAQATQPLAALGTARAKANENRALLNNHILSTEAADRAELERHIK